MNKLLIVGVLGLLLVSCVSYIDYSLGKNDRDDTLENREYQGPVPLGYDLEHFRRTGETIMEINE